MLESWLAYVFVLLGCVVVCCFFFQVTVKIVEIICYVAFESAVIMLGQLAHKCPARPHAFLP